LSPSKEKSSPFEKGSFSLYNERGKPDQTSKATGERKRDDEPASFGVKRNFAVEPFGDPELASDPAAAAAAAAAAATVVRRVGRVLHV